MVRRPRKGAPGVAGDSPHADLIEKRSRLYFATDLPLNESKDNGSDLPDD